MNASVLFFPVVADCESNPPVVNSMGSDSPVHLGLPYMSAGFVLACVLYVRMCVCVCMCVRVCVCVCE